MRKCDYDLCIRKKKIIILKTDGILGFVQKDADIDTNSFLQKPENICNCVVLHV